MRPYVIPFDAESAKAWEVMKAGVIQLLQQGRLRPEVAEQLCSDTEAVQWQQAFRRQQILLAALDS